MDSIDKKILLELMGNSRIPLTRLAKKIRISREVITYRINRFQEHGIVLKFVTNINTQRLGFLSAATFVNIKAKREAEFEQFVKGCDFASWSGEFSGVWRFGLDIYGKNPDQIHANFQSLYTKFKDDIIDHRMTLYHSKYFFHKKYLSTVQKNETVNNNVDYKLDKKDMLILQALSNNSRIDILQLCNVVKLTSPAISHRIKNLENSGYIEGYSIFVDVSKMGLYQYSVFIVNKNSSEKKKLITYLSAHSQVPFIAEYIGDPFLEFGVAVENPYSLRKTLQEIEESFPDNRITEVFLIQKEFLSVGPPQIVFNN